MSDSVHGAARGFNGGPQAFGWSLLTLVVTAMNSVGVGLLLSTLVESSEAAMALTPIALIPQVVLGGLMVPMTTNPLLQWPMYAMPARWGFQGVVAQERLAIATDAAWVLDLNRPDVNSPDNFVLAGKFRCAEAQISSLDFNGAWGFTNYPDSRASSSATRASSRERTSVLPAALPTTRKRLK